MFSSAARLTAARLLRDNWALGSNVCAPRKTRDGSHQSSITPGCHHQQESGRRHSDLEQGATRIFGYTADEVIGKPVTILMPPERINEEPGILARLRAGERIDHYQTVRQHKDGTLLDISLTVSPIRDKAGRIIAASKIARDITAQKRAEAALRDNERRLHELLAAIPAAIYTTDAARQNHVL